MASANDAAGIPVLAASSSTVPADTNDSPVGSGDIMKPMGRSRWRTESNTNQLGMRAWSKAAPSMSWSIRPKSL
jgi:hypothetical protein